MPQMKQFKNTSEWLVNTLIEGVFPENWKKK